MDIEIQEKIIRKWADVHFPEPESFVIECGNGWARLIDDVLGELAVLKKGDPAMRGFSIMDITRQSGRLDIIAQGGTDEAYKLINLAEQVSETICELSGKPGSLRVSAGQLITLSDEEAAKMGLE